VISGWAVSFGRVINLEEPDLTDLQQTDFLTAEIAEAAEETH
jgi:hypothetical protein